MGVVSVEPCGQTTLRVHVVQVVYVNVDGPRGSNSAAGLKASMATVVRVMVKALGVFCGTHVLRVIVGDSSDRNPSISIWV